tara:strand:+ start:131127 stop:132692 length:1566 start_codon:yes stop_codon:yes gene_type:complete
MARKKKATRNGKPAPIKGDERSLFPMLGQNLETIQDTELSAFTSDALSHYGAYVVEDRAVPDYRDGLKPVHRSLLWSLAGLNLRPTSSYKKSARTVGDCIGKYHPHGDAAAYGAMVTIANTMPPAVDGQGNWGTPINPAAAQRYTEARMSKFAHMFMLDRSYLDVVPTVPNFSGDDSIPLFLPALLPYALFNGNTPAPAYGVRAGNPSFSFRSVSKVVIAMLKGKEMSGKKLAKVLEIQHPWGCTSVTDPSDFEEMIATGKGSIIYAPEIEEDYDKRLIRVRSFVPSGLASTAQIDKTLEKISKIDGVRKCYSKQGKKSVGSGPYGALFIIECQRNLDTDQFYDIHEAVEKQVTNSVGYRLGVTVRKANDKNAFHYLNYEKFFRTWIKYRINLELRLIKHLLEKAEKELHLQKVYLFAVENMEKLLKVLPKALVSEDPDAALAKGMKMPKEDATIILNRQVRKLAKLEAADLKKKIKDIEAEIKQLKVDKEAPGDRAARDTEHRVKSYLKNPDKMKSGLTF